MCQNPTRAPAGAAAASAARLGELLQRLDQAGSPRTSSSIQGAEAQHLTDRSGPVALHQPDRTAALIDQGQLNSVSSLARTRQPSSTRAQLLELAHVIAELAGREQAKLLRQDRRFALGKREQVTSNLERDVHPSQA